MAASAEATCDDCYFRQEGLCALRLERPCPTFRASVSGRLAPPRHPQLVPVPGRVRASAAA
jgi:hypothetical protein